ncbi:MAG: cyanophycinase [Thermomicrobiales bacterium]
MKARQAMSLAANADGAAPVRSWGMPTIRNAGSPGETIAQVEEAIRHLQRHGPVLAIGGHEDTGRQAEILQRFLQLGGGKRSQIVIIPAASSEPEDMADEYEEAFGKLGAKRTEVLRLANRDDANATDHLKMIREATGVFVTGGDQSRLVELLIGTHLMDLLRVRNAEGVVVAGTSAGASLVAEHMLLGGSGIGGDSGDASPRKAMIQMTSGLGLIQDVIIDQHFSERGRMGRLLSAFAGNPGLVGIGLDENTAILINEHNILETLGEGAVTIIDGRDTISNYFECEPGDVLTIIDSSLHVLGPHQQFDLSRHAPINGFAGTQGIESDDA